jgi:hypothetical protein
MAGLALAQVEQHLNKWLFADPPEPKGNRSGQSLPVPIYSLPPVPNTTCRCRAGTEAAASLRFFDVGSS